jgi:hypothetical protein
VAGESARKRYEGLARQAERYRRGAEGEEATGEALMALPPTSWQVLHDVAWPGRQLANIDHVVVGPPGVFVIDSKNWSGQITVEDGVLRQGRRTRVPTVRSAEAARAAVAGLLPRVDPRHVHAVLSFTGEAPGRAIDGVRICSTDTLVRLLTSSKAVLPDDQVRAVAESLRSVLSSATEPRPAPVKPRSKRRTRKGRSGLRTGVSALAGLAMAAMLLFNPGPVIALSNGIAGLLSEQMQPPEDEPVQPKQKVDKKKHKAPTEQKNRSAPSK